MKNVYFDNAATTPIHAEVIAAMEPYWHQYYGNPSSIHALGRQNRAAIEKSRRTIAQTIGSSIGEVFFTAGGTEANNTILWGAVHSLGIKHIVSSPIEHHCITHTLNAIQQYHPNVNVSFVELQDNGHVNLAHLENILQQCKAEQQPTLVSLMHVNNEIANILPLQKVGDLCAEYNALFHSDTVQSFGHYPINVAETKIHFLSGAAHKFHGPKAAGFFYASSDYQIAPYLTGGAQERNMRAGTENVYGIVGLGKATEIAYRDLAENQEKVYALKQYTIEKIKQHFPEVAFNGDSANTPDKAAYRILNLAFPPSPFSDMLTVNLDIAGIAVSGGSACSSGVDSGSHVLAALQANPEGGNIRLSFSIYNTMLQVDFFIETLRKIFSRY